MKLNLTTEWILMLHSYTLIDHFNWWVNGLKWKLILNIGLIFFFNSTFVQNLLAFLFLDKFKWRVHSFLFNTNMMTLQTCNCERQFNCSPKSNYKSIVDWKWALVKTLVLQVIFCFFVRLCANSFAAFVIDCTFCSFGKVSYTIFAYSDCIIIKQTKQIYAKNNNAPNMYRLILKLVWHNLLK